ncbi:MAG: ABC transporter ATP-binding protein/permease [Alphaproteobacteria bacterium]|nr:ABC transporter ATP-binding protein/permease [Alphaproteobacteria bacterium]
MPITFFQLIKPWWKSEEKLVAWLGFLIALIFNIFPIIANILLNIWNVEFYDSLQQLNQSKFIKALWDFSWIVTLTVIAYCSSAYIVRWYSLRWRRWATYHFLDQWIDKQSFYSLMLLQNAPDNPDQRISDDLNTFTNVTITLALSYIQEIGNVIAFIGILAGISGPIAFKLLGIDFNIPAYLVWIALLYSGFGTYLAIKIGKPLIKLDIQQEKVEADFRYHLVRVRERREEIAFYKGGVQEHKGLNQRFSAIWDNVLRVLKCTIYLNLMQNFYMNASTVVPILAAAPRLFSGAITFGVLMQIGGAFRQLQNSLSIIVLSFQNIAQWMAASKRLQQFCGMLNMLKTQQSPFIYKESRDIALKDVTLKTVDDRVILDQINLEIKPGERVLIKGPSGLGKTTLMRLLARLWPYGKGEVMLPTDNIFFSPQRCYAPLGNLRNAISYPSPEPFADKAILDALSRSGLGYLEEFLEIEDDWINRLSQGEQQRLAIARILLHKPKWLMMDEPTAALDEEKALEVFETLTEFLPDTTIITITHDNNLKPFHNRVIALKV